jgi:hypothetical protein
MFSGARIVALRNNIGRRVGPAADRRSLSRYFSKPLAYMNFLNFFNVFSLRMLQASYSNMRRCW